VQRGRRRMWERRAVGSPGVALVAAAVGIVGQIAPSTAVREPMRSSAQLPGVDLRDEPRLSAIHDQTIMINTCCGPKRSYNGRIRTYGRFGGAGSVVAKGVYADLSPDGARIAFARVVPSQRILIADVYVADANGSNRRRLTRDRISYAPSWSPDGTRIAMIKRLDPGGDEDLFVMNADGSNPRRLTEGQQPGADYAWSPDGTAIAYVNARGIHVVDVATGEVSPLRVTPKNVAHHSPSWSPDGTQLVFGRDFRSSSEVWAIALSGGDPVRLTHGYLPEYSSTGEITFQRREGKRQIAHTFILTLEGDVRRLTRGRNDDGHFDWAPDGRHLAMCTHPWQSRASSVRVFSADGSTTAKVGFDAEVCYWIEWEGPLDSTE
jgi:Tol biopolymer transport system component